MNECVGPVKKLFGLTECTFKMQQLFRFEMHFTFTIINFANVFSHGIIQE